MALTTNKPKAQALDLDTYQEVQLGYKPLSKPAPAAERGPTGLSLSAAPREKPQPQDKPASVTALVNELLAQLLVLKNEHLCGAGDETLDLVRSIQNLGRDVRDQVWTAKRFLG